MKQKLSKGKSAPKPRKAATGRKTGRRSARTNRAEAEVALATLLALLHADRWLFEAAELARKGKLSREVEAFNRIRLAIVQSLNRLQPRAYGAMSKSGLLSSARSLR